MSPAGGLPSTQPAPSAALNPESPTSRKPRPPFLPAAPLFSVSPGTHPTPVRVSPLPLPSDPLLFLSSADNQWPCCPHCCGWWQRAVVLWALGGLPAVGAWSPASALDPRGDSSVPDRLVPRVCPGPSGDGPVPGGQVPHVCPGPLWGWPCPRPGFLRPGNRFCPRTLLSHGCALGPVGTRSCSAKGHTAAEVLKGPGFLTPALRPLPCLTGCLPTPHHHPGPCQVSQGALPQQVAARSRGQI